MGEIFISYSRLDAEIVDKLVDSVGKAGMAVWLDRDDIKVGNSWRVEIVQAIDSCDAFVLMLSANSAASKNVHKEVILAQDSGRAIFVVMLETVRLPAEIRYQLAGLQFINLELLGLEKSAHRLIETLQEQLKKIKRIGDQSHNQAELVIQGINISAFTAEKQEQLLAFISNLANTDQSQLKIATVTAGSVHIFMDMPSAIAFQLKTRALNRDNRFQQFGITSLRLAGGQNFINISLGLLIASATIGPVQSFGLRTQSFFSSIFGLTIGNMLMVLTPIIAAIGIGMFFLQSQEITPPPASNPALAWTLTPMLTSTADADNTPSPTASPTEPPAPVYKILSAVVQAENIACRHGPGDQYLYQYGLIEGNKMQVMGRDINSTWGYVQVEGFEKPCWVNFKYINLDGDVTGLESLYPGKVTIPLSFLWPEPKNVYTTRTRDGNQVAIYWDEYLLPLGEREDDDSPRYLLELWLCKDGALQFTSIGTMQPNLLVTDEAGCIEPSHGVVYLVEKHGYAGPVEIPWPAAAP